MENSKFRKIEDRYGSFTFRMSITHLINAGKSNFTDENIIKWLEKIQEQGRTDKENGVFRLMTADYECEIVRCAAELSKLGIWDLLRYIVKHVDVGFAIVNE